MGEVMMPGRGGGIKVYTELETTRGTDASGDRAIVIKLPAPWGKIKAFCFCFAGNSQGSTDVHYLQKALAGTLLESNPFWHTQPVWTACRNQPADTDTEIVYRTVCSFNPPCMLAVV